ncbi:hypothetical protein O0L34_g5671 [Tuta absoluta]|nr:hypothetical protein O0L34_g5671 [Tuta absoluta]
MVKVQVEQGWLEGEQLDSVSGDGRFFSFKGIPYAAPPVGKLRFKAPQPLVSWQGVRKATQHGPKCPQRDIFSKQIIPGSEDCLYLNVYTKDISPKSPLPVMVFIHGGGFKSGSGDEDFYGGDFLVHHGVVLVTINYRLDALGFLCLDTEEVPGNAGLKDQVAALKWVQKNIFAFGGDPTNVTIFGESAGGSSTALHVLSPLSKGLFKRAIPMSGVPFCDWSIPFEPRKRAFTLGKILGFETEDPKALLEYLQSLPAEKFVDTNPTIMGFEEKSYNMLKMYHFTPVVEKNFGQHHFMTEEPLEALKQGHVNDVDVLIGNTDQETIVGIPSFVDLLKMYDRYPEVFVPRKILNKSTPGKILEIAERIRKYYFGDKPIDKTSMKEAVTYFSEVCFTYDVNKYTNLLLSGKPGSSKVYRYRFSCVSERNIFGKYGQEYGITGASHLEDLMYLFDAKSVKLPLDRNSESYKMIQQTCALFTNFAKYGNPTPDSSLGFTWPEYDIKDQSFVDIADQLTVGRHLDADAIKFWESIYQYADIGY